MTRISIKRIKRKIKGSRAFRWLKQLILWIKLLWHYVCVPFAWLKEFATVKHPKIWYSFTRMLPGRLDRYIIGKFIGTYFFAILLIISISIVFDVNENLSKFTEYHAPLKAIVFDYYMNFVPYFANLFSPLFVFIAVIFFTSKMAGNSEIIAIMAAGVSFKRLMRPYMLSCVLISIMSYYLSAYVIPHGTVIRQNFESLYKNNKKTVAMVDAVPIERLLVETDAPYLTPVPFRGKRNTPLFVEYTARKVAEIKGLTFEETAAITRDNAMRFYGIKG